MVRAGRHRKLVRCVSANFRIRAHRSATIRTGLSAGCLRLLRAQPRRRLTVNATTESQTGQVGESRRITLVLK